MCAPSNDIKETNHGVVRPPLAFAARLPNLEIVRTFDFSPAIQRMSCIVRNVKTKELYVFVKGNKQRDFVVLSD